MCRYYFVIEHWSFHPGTQAQQVGGVRHLCQTMPAGARRTSGFEPRLGQRLTLQPYCHSYFHALYPLRPLYATSGLTCSSRRTVWRGWWFRPPLCWTSPPPPLAPAPGSLRKSPACVSSHLKSGRAHVNSFTSTQRRTIRPVPSMRIGRDALHLMSKGIT